MNNDYKTFSDFYCFYLDQHANRNCRRLHFIGSALVLVILAVAVYVNQWRLLLFAPIAGYAFAWIGHYFFEKNKPATFTYPLYSFIGDWVMFRDILLGKIPW